MKPPSPGLSTDLSRASAAEVKSPPVGGLTDLTHARAAEVTPDVLERARRVQLLVLDVDGVLTDGRLHITANGEETKVFHVRDGSGIVAVQRAGVMVAIISGRNSAAVTRRAGELGIRHVFQGITDKRAALDALLAATGVNADALACVGDDTPDVPMLERATLAVAVADAHATARGAAHWTTLSAGGHGAVREVCDLLLTARGT